jgi:beta-lactamase class D
MPVRLAFILILVATSCRATLPPGAAGECFLLQDLSSSRVIAVNREECALRRSPASTFKIPHALIALETGAIKPGEVVPWDGTRYSSETWQRDHDLTSAIRWSALPFFRRTASIIGADTMEKRLTSLRYGSGSVRNDLTSFWVNGDLTISGDEMLSFLRRMFRYELPVSRANVDIVKSALTMPPGEVTLAAGSHPFVITTKVPLIVRAKTGNTRVADERVSWLVGHLEHGSRQYVFVARVRRKGELAGTAGADLAGRYLNETLKRD